MARRRGRPSQAGKRRLSGRLRARPATADQGNDRVRESRAAFAIFQNGRAGNELGDAIGKAWAAGLLDGFAADAQAMRDSGREYGLLWRIRHAALGARTSSLERRSKATTPVSIGGSSASDRRLERMESALAGHGRISRDAFFGLCVDYQDSDSLPPFVERLINERMAAKGRQVIGPLPVRGDRERLERAAEMLVDLVRGRRP